MGRCEGRVAIVTGAGRGLGRAHALELASQGAAVVVNDLGVAADGSSGEDSPAQQVVAEIEAAGGRAVTNADDVSDWAQADHLIATAIETYGRLDVLVNNAGIIRDRMLVNLTESDWDSVITVHLRGTFAPLQAAARHWRSLSKQGVDNDARIINTTSGSGLYGNVGQANYAAAKAAIASLTRVAALELANYGVTVNAIAPGARTRMTENPNRKAPSPFAVTPGATFDHGAPENASPLVAWLAGPESRGVTGQVINITGGVLSIAEGWHAGPLVELDHKWSLEELDSILPGLVAAAPGQPNMLGVLPEADRVGVKP